MSSDPIVPRPDATASTDEPWEALDDVERALLAQLHFSAGAWREGLALVRSSGGRPRGLALLEARALFALGERDAALDVLRRWGASAPDASLGLYYQAQLSMQAGRVPEAAAALRALVARCPDFPGALQSLAAAMFP